MIKQNEIRFVDAYLLIYLIISDTQSLKEILVSLDEQRFKFYSIR